LEDQDTVQDENGDTPSFDHPGFQQVPKFNFEAQYNYPNGPHTTNNFFNNNYTINYNNFDPEGKKFMGTVLRPEVCKFYQFNENITQNIYI
jgi:hypothetical protein